MNRLLILCLLLVCSTYAVPAVDQCQTELDCPIPIIQACIHHISGNYCESVFRRLDLIRPDGKCFVDSECPAGQTCAIAIPKQLGRCQASRRFAAAAASFPVVGPCDQFGQCAQGMKCVPYNISPTGICIPVKL